MTRRLSTDAKIVLERAGFEVGYVDRGRYLTIYHPELGEYWLEIESGTVNDDKVCKILTMVEISS